MLTCAIFMTHRIPVFIYFNRYTLPSQHGLHADVYLNTETSVPTDEDWTDQETLFLLEGIDLYKENWGKVADHVNQYMYGGQVTRSHDDCILAFVRLPIEDPYLKLEPHSTTVGKSKEEPFPLAATGNPLMATLAFLSRAVDPAVAAVGAKTALVELSKKPATGAGAGAGAGAGSAASASVVGGGTMDTGLDDSPGSAGGGTAAAGDGEEKKSATVISKEKLSALSHTVLDAAGKKATLLANAEEERMKALIATLVQTQLQKLELKLRHFETIEMQLQRDVEQAAQQRTELLNDRLVFQQRVASVKQVLVQKEKELLQQNGLGGDYGAPVVDALLSGRLGGGDGGGGGAAAASTAGSGF